MDKLAITAEIILLQTFVPELMLAGDFPEAGVMYDISLNLSSPLSQEKSRQFSNCVALILSQLSSGSCHHPGISSTRPVAAESGVSPVPLRLSDLG